MTDVCFARKGVVRVWRSVTRPLPVSPLAAVASVVITLLDVYTGEVTASIPPVIDFLLRPLAILVGSVVSDTLWYTAFDESGA